jgi:hypothetical protein
MRTLLLRCERGERKKNSTEELNFLAGPSTNTPSKKGKLLDVVPGSFLYECKE